MIHRCSTSVLISTVCMLACGCQPAPREEDEISKTMRMIEEAKSAPRQGAPVGNNIYIRVERLSASGEHAAGLAALWVYAGRHVTVSGGDGLGGGGVRMGTAGPEFDARVAAWSGKARSSSRTSEEIMVMSGAEGHLWVGRSVMVPVLNIVTESGRTVILERTSVGAALRVRPRLLDDGRIQLDLQPEFSVAEGRQAGAYTVTAMTSRVIVSPGQKLVLGANESSREGSVSCGLFGYGASGERVQTLVIVQAERM